MRRKTQIFLMGEQHLDAAPINCLHTIIQKLANRPDIHLTIAAEYESDKHTKEIQEWFAEVIELSDQILNHPQMKPYVNQIGNRRYLEHSPAAREAFANISPQSLKPVVIDRYFNYMLQHERMKEAVKFFAAISQSQLQIIGIDMPASFLQSHHAYDHPEAMSTSQMLDLRDEYMARQLIQHTDSNITKKHHVIFAYLGSAHVKGVKEKLDQHFLDVNAAVEVIPLAVFSEHIYQEILATLPELMHMGLSMPETVITIPQSSSGAFICDPFLEMINEHLALPQEHRSMLLNRQQRQLLSFEETEKQLQQQEPFPAKQPRSNSPILATSPRQLLASASSLSLTLFATASQKLQGEQEKAKITQEINPYLLLILSCSSLLVFCLLLLLIYQKCSHQKQHKKLKLESAGYQLI